MKGWKRAGTTLAGSAAAGALIWFVPHFDRWSTGGYWGAMATFAAAGLESVGDVLDTANAEEAEDRKAFEEADLDVDVREAALEMIEEFESAPAPEPEEEADDEETDEEAGGEDGEEATGEDGEKAIADAEQPEGGDKPAPVTENAKQ